MTVLLSHPTGNENCRAVLRALVGVERLESFHTAIALPIGGQRTDLNTPQFWRRIQQRNFSEVPWSKIRLHPTRELFRLAAQRLKLGRLIHHESGWACVDAVYRSVDERTAKYVLRSKADISGVYAYEDGALETFLAAKKRGIVCFYDLPIAYWRTLDSLLREEVDRHPEWAGTMIGLSDSDAKRNRKDQELCLADHVVVASQFTENSLRRDYGDRLKISRISYGCPIPLTDAPTMRSGEEPLRILFVGHLTQRKGLADLISALKRLTVDWHLTLVGPCLAHPPQALIELIEDPRCTWLGAIPHEGVLEIMSRSHVLAFPSIVEGFGLVITEAMSSGLPVIATTNTGGQDVITHGVDGFVIPIRTPQRLAELLDLLATNESLRYEMANNALCTAARLSWKLYEKCIADLVQAHT